MKTWHWLVVGGVLLFLWKRSQVPNPERPPSQSVFVQGTLGQFRLASDSFAKRLGLL